MYLKENKRDSSGCGGLIGSILGLTLTIYIIYKIVKYLLR
jgi:hypothetical protein